MMVMPAVAEKDRCSLEQIEARMQEIESLVVGGDWEKIESLLHELPVLTARIPEQERRKVLQGLIAHVDQISARALAQRDEIAGQLSTIRTGRRATATYAATSALVQHD